MKISVINVGFSLIALTAATAAFAQAADESSTALTQARGGAVLQVCPSGCDFTSIQQAIDSAPSGYTIHISAGVFNEAIRISDKSLRLQGEGTDKTVIDATGLGRVITLTCSSDRNIQIVGITITNGQYNLSDRRNGTGLLNEGCNAILVNTVVANNSGQSAIGNNNKGTLTIKSSSIVKNRSDWDGGITNTGTVSLKDSIVSDNAGGHGGSGGIGNSGTLFLEGTTIANNVGPSDCFTCNNSGGIANLGGTVSLKNSTVSGNRCFVSSTGSCPGGGIVNLGGVVSVNKSTISSNRAPQGGGVFNGQEGKLTLTESFITNNEAGSPYNGRGGGLLNESGTLTLLRSQVTGNTAVSGEGGQGGGLYNDSAGTLVLKGSLVTKNTAAGAPESTPMGGGLFNNGGFVSATGTTIIDNIPDNCVGVNFGCP